jgi:hypothetical protein
MFSIAADHVDQGMKGRTGHLDDWLAETPESIAARLESARSSQAQARRTMGVMSIISMMMLVASYNAYLSYDSKWILELARKQFAGETDVARVLTEEALKDWAASRSVQVPLLGIRTSVDDAPVLGTATLLVLAFWLVLLTRRENHTVGLLLRDTDTEQGGADQSRFPRGAPGPSYSSGQRWLIFHSIVSNSLFITCDRSLAPVQSLARTPSRAGRETGLTAWMSEQAFAFLSRFFFDFPVIVSTIVFLLDRWSYFEPDAFAVNAQAPGAGSAFFWFSMVVFLVCWIPLVLCCRRSRLYSEATGRVLKEYGGRLRADLLQHQEIAGHERFNHVVVTSAGG